MKTMVMTVVLVLLATAASAQVPRDAVAQCANGWYVYVMTADVCRDQGGVVAAKPATPALPPGVAEAERAYMQSYRAMQDASRRRDELARQPIMEPVPPAPAATVLDVQRVVREEADRQAQRDRRLAYLLRPDPLAYWYTPRPVVVTQPYVSSVTVLPPPATYHFTPIPAPQLHTPPLLNFHMSCTTTPIGRNVYTNCY